MPDNDTSPKPIEITRFRISDPMPVSKLRSVLEAFDAADSDTVRFYNGLLIVERPPASA